jgi:hypothetical protein
MPVRYRFDSNIVVIETIGEYSMEEFRTTILDSLNDSQRPTNPFLLIDLTQSVSIYNRSSEDIKTMARFVASLGDRFSNRIAMVGSKDLPYGMMRMGSAGSEERGIEAEVFRSFAEARKWLLSRNS